MGRSQKTQSGSLVLFAEGVIRRLLSRFLDHNRAMTGIPVRHEGCEVLIMGEKHGVKAETLKLIKQVAYALQIGPYEISSPAGDPATYNVKFKNCRGEEQEVFVPATSRYSLIEDALKFADIG